MGPNLGHLSKLNLPRTAFVLGQLFVHISPLESESSLQGRTHPRLAPTISNILNNNLTETPSHNARSVQITRSVTFSDSAPDHESSALRNCRPAHGTSPIFTLSEPQSDEGVAVHSHEQCTYDAGSSARDLCPEINNRHGSHSHNDDLLSDTREGLVRPVCTKVQKSVSDEGEQPEQPEQPETEQQGDQEIDRQRGDNVVVASSSSSASRRAKRKLTFGFWTNWICAGKGGRIMQTRGLKKENSIPRTAHAPVSAPVHGNVEARN
jgi:hypothetical protein